MTAELPEENTLERWAWDYIHHPSLEHRFTPPAVPSGTETVKVARRVAKPSRPAELTVIERGPKSVSDLGLRENRLRAKVFHTFLHHELQAAELMCWAILAFPDAPEAFRRGLAKVCLDEVRHMNLYREYIEALGCRFGDHPVRDWFWQRVPGAESPAHFVATMGIGFEGANLDHTARFAQRLRAVGDDRGAALQELICEEEIPHVRFAMHWFHRWTDGDLDRWAEYLPKPLSPWLMQGKPLNREDRLRAGMSEEFMQALVQWVPFEQRTGTPESDREPQQTPSMR